MSRSPYSTRRVFLSYNNASPLNVRKWSTSSMTLESLESIGANPPVAMTFVPSPSSSLHLDANASTSPT